MITCATFRAAIALDDIDAVPPPDLAAHAAGCEACAAMAPEIALLGGRAAPCAVDARRPLPRVRIFFWRRAAAAVLIVGLVAVAARFATAPTVAHAAGPTPPSRAAAGPAIDPSHFRPVAAAPAVTQSTFSDVIGGRVVRSQLTVTHWSSSPPVRP